MLSALSGCTNRTADDVAGITADNTTAESQTPDNGTAGGAGGPVSPTPPPMSMGMSVASHGPNETMHYHPQDAALGRATWSVGH